MEVQDVTGGTNAEGIDETVFAMPKGMAIRYDRPAAALADYITGYHVYRTTDATPQVDRFLPATANVRIALDAGPIAVSIGRRTYDPLPVASLFGPTSTALQATTRGGVMIGFGISALGWARLFRRPAGDFRNRIVPLEDVLGHGFTRRLVEALQDATSDAMIAPILDAMLIARLGEEHADAPRIRQLMAVIAEDGPTDIAAVAAQIGMHTHGLRRLSVRHFGFPPKMLLMRARFLRSFLRLMAAGDDAEYSAIDDSYFDASHFLRDSAMFLGTTPRRFMALTKPFLEASVRARQAVLGAPTQVLHDIATAPIEGAPASPAKRVRAISGDAAGIPC